MSLKPEDFPQPVVPGVVPKLTPSIWALEKIILLAPKLFLLLTAFLVVGVWFGDRLLPWRLNGFWLIAWGILVGFTMQAGKKGDKLGRAIIYIVYGLFGLVGVTAMIVAPLGLLYIIGRNIFENGFSPMLLIPLAVTLFFAYIVVRLFRSWIK